MIGAQTFQASKQFRIQAQGLVYKAYQINQTLNRPEETMTCLALLAELRKEDENLDEAMKSADKFIKL